MNNITSEEMSIMKSYWTKASNDPVGKSSVFWDILYAYTVHTRYYHNHKHLLDCFKAFERYSDRIDRHDLMILSIFYHDIIYDVTRDDNETRSACLAFEFMVHQHFEPKDIVTVYRRILRSTYDGMYPPETKDDYIFMTIDLSILHADEERFMEYERGVRMEYSHVNDTDFRNGRLSILKSLLKKLDGIFYNDEFRKKAVTNITNSIDLLKGGIDVVA